MSARIGRLNRAFGGFIPQRQFCLPKVAHWALSSCLVRLQSLQGGLLTHLKVWIEPLGPPPECPLAYVLSGHSIHHLSGSQRGRSKLATSTSGNAAGSGCAPPAKGKGIPNAAPTSAGLYFHFAAGLIQGPIDSRTC
ncbi:hypothetical protein JTE90_020004 [Oedothorax gibbosus]|uniref:Uncharacterized protein n=1 Tax=Oedothorax gibbosus TaxID=931172 RepID=A0AAV6TFF5_9ARAC|nr:hypothetical protein JTE90_020004 [Oedothorax gibbosus]